MYLRFCKPFHALYTKQCNVKRHALGEVRLELLDIQVNPVVWAINSHVVLRKEDYKEAFEKKASRLVPEISLSEERFKKVKDIVFEAVSSAGNEDECVTQISQSYQVMEHDTTQDSSGKGVDYPLTL